MGFFDENPLVSVVITTRNRKDDLMRAIESCYAQDYSPLEILVYDDASDDGTCAGVASVFPEVRLHASKDRKGYICHRNKGFEQSQGKYVFSIDDDAYFLNSNIIARTVSIMESDSTIGSVAIPFIEPMERVSQSTRSAARTLQPLEELRTYIGCAHAVRRDLALQLGGYREFFVHQGEERDFCLRVLNAGYRIVYGESDCIVHMVSPCRDSGRIMYFGARNAILFDCLNLPFPEVLVRLIWDPIAIIKYRYSFAGMIVKLRGIIAGILISFRFFPIRQAVTREVYRRYRRLPGHGPKYCR